MYAHVETGYRENINKYQTEATIEMRSCVRLGFVPPPFLHCYSSNSDSQTNARGTMVNAICYSDSQTNARGTMVNAICYRDSQTNARGTMVTAICYSDSSKQCVVFCE